LRNTLVVRLAYRSDALPPEVEREGLDAFTVIGVEM
jgi:hypothetical protein